MWPAGRCYVISGMGIMLILSVRKCLCVPVKLEKIM